MRTVTSLPAPAAFRALAVTTLLLALAAVPPVRGSGTRVGFKDAFATGRANAFVATADNPSAVYYNPAGLTQLEGSQFEGNIYTVAVSSDYKGAGGTASMDNSSHTIPAFYASWKTKGSPWAIGVGLYAPFGLSTQWPAASPLRTFALKNTETYRTFNFSAAYEVSKQLSVGAGLTYNKVTTDLSRAIGVFGPDDLFRFQGSGHAVGFTLGGLWKPAPEHSFGLSYQSNTSVKLDGTTDTIPLFTAEPSKATFDFPDVVIVGYSYRPTRLWNLEVNLDWTNWNRLNTVTVTKASGPVPLAFNWQSGLFYEFGATRYFENGLHVSAGYLYTENSTPDATFTPALPDSNKSFYSVGVGYNSESFSFDLAWHYGDGGTRTVTGSPPSLLGTTADGTYKNSLNAVSISAGWHF
jgi:long-chain fatty acid transport protein